MAIGETFLQGYVTCALWSSNDGSTPQGGEPLDSNYGPENFAPQAMQQMEAECAEFQQANAELLNRFYEYYDDGRAGHDFWLNRNGHGSGFWDEDGDKAVNKALSEASKACGERDLYVGDDGMIYVYPEKQTPVSASLKKKGAWPTSGPTPADEGIAAAKAENIGTSSRDYLLAALQSKPLTTGEAEAALGGNRHSNKAYPLLKALQQEGLVTQKQMRWYAVPGKAHNAGRPLSVPDQHQKRIAIQTLKMSDAMVGVMGGMNKEEARNFLRRIGIDPARYETPDLDSNANANSPEKIGSKRASEKMKDHKVNCPANGGARCTCGYTEQQKAEHSNKTAMSRKDYILIANVLKEARAAGEHADVAELFAQALKQENPNFNEEHFLGVVNGTKELQSRPARPPRMAGVHVATNPEWIREAEALIEADDPMIYDVAADSGQIVANVKHMPWFVNAVAQWLEEGNLPKTEAPHRVGLYVSNCTCPECEKYREAISLGMK